MNLLLESISWLGILLPLAIVFLEVDKKKFYKMVSGYFLLTALVLSMKFLFGPSRDYIDPFQFPSMHMVFASLLMFFYPNLFSVLFALLVGETRILLGVHNGFDILFGFIIAGLTYFVVNFIEDREVRRQFVHLGLSMFFAFLLYLNRLFGIIVLVSSLVGYLLFYDKGIVRDLTKYFGRSKFDMGTINLLAGLLLVSVFWSEAWISAIFLGWVDSLATIFGHFKKSKSFVGFVGGLVGGTIAAFVAHTNLIFTPLVALVELLSPTDDNLIIPISVWVIFSVLNLLKF